MACPSISFSMLPPILVKIASLFLSNCTVWDLIHVCNSLTLSKDPPFFVTVVVSDMPSCSQNNVLWLFNVMTDRSVQMAHEVIISSSNMK